MTATTTNATPENARRFEVFSVKRSSTGATIWLRAGSAFVNRDNSINVYLDVLPLDGKLHLRPPLEKLEMSGETETN